MAQWAFIHELPLSHLYLLAISYLPQSEIIPEFLELLKAELAGAIQIHHGHHAATGLQTEPVERELCGAGKGIYIISTRIWNNLQATHYAEPLLSILLTQPDTPLPNSAFTFKWFCINCTKRSGHNQYGLARLPVPRNHLNLIMTTVLETHVANHEKTYKIWSSL